MSELKENNIVQAWLVLLLAIFFGGSLAGIQLVLGPTIETNKINETRQKVPELVAVSPDHAASLEILPRSVNVEKAGKKIVYSVFETKLDGKSMGWVAKTNGQGYADKIELLVGFDPGLKTITGLFVLDQKETPGLGNKIVTPEWRSQFVDKPIGKPLEVVKTGAKASNEINAITGATISSRSVTGIINSAVKDLKAPLSEGTTTKESKG